MRARKRVAVTRPETVGDHRGRRGKTHHPRRYPSPRWRDWDVYLVISAGGAGGGLARWGAGVMLPGTPGAIPWATLMVNATGSFLLGALMVWVLDVWPSSRYLRPFLAVGVLGGYTTFSTFSVQTRALLVAGEISRAFSYAVGSLAAGMLAVSAGIVVARALAGHPISRRARQNTGEEVTDGIGRPGLQTDRVRW